MEYRELEDVYEFHRNMRQTPWTRLFPHWWDDTDALLLAIGNEVERIKAISIFALLNQGIKPPVLLWQESIDHKEYHANFNATSLPYSASIQAPLYKTWGKITLKNNTVKDLDGLIIKLDDNHGYIINQLIAQEDEIVINLTDDKVTLNNKVIKPQKIGNGLPYFITQQNKKKYDENTPLHNEVVRITLETHRTEEIECDIDIDMQMDNVVFTDEQNIEITGLEAVPIERVELYAEYDFPFNKSYNGWHKVYDKKYDSNTNVVYDMITTQIYTKKFYVDVYFKTLQYPYRVGFPCFKDAEEDSAYHVNTGLDVWGVQLGLERRKYKSNIPEEEYYRTYPIYYPFDIEQDYWYFKRLTSEYAWNDLAKNDVDLLDTDNNPIVRLYAIDPFMEDLVVHAKSIYPTDKEFVNYNNYNPIAILQRHAEGIGKQTEYSDIINLIANNQKRTSITLKNKTDNNDVIYKRLENMSEPTTAYELSEAEMNIINSDNRYTQEEKEAIIQSKAIRSVGWHKDTTHQSTELITYFDLSTLPEDINIDDIEIIVEGDSTDNKTNKYSTEKTGILIPNYKDNEQFFIELTPDKPYQLKKQLITYANNQISNELNDIEIDDFNIIQSYNIGVFEGKIQGFVEIPFELKENDEIVDDITEIWLYYNDTIRKASYKEKDGQKYIYAYVPNIPLTNQLTIICKSETHYPFTCNINISKSNKYEEETNKVLYQYISGPIVDGVTEDFSNIVEWRTNDIRNLIQKQGIYFRHVIKNNDEQSMTTVHLYNIQAKVSYSQKKANFTMSTYVNRENVTAPCIGTYNITISNIGDKALQTHVDILTPPNIKLETNHIDIDLKPNSTFTFKNAADDDTDGGIKIIPNYPIDDGFYDIITICEDQVRRNTIEVFSDGLIEAPINITPHSCRYNDEVTLKATIKPVDGSIINSNVAKVQFYINGYSVGKTTVKKNKAELTIRPNDPNFNFITSGNLSLEAKFLGTTKYAPSSRKSSIFISKENTRITLLTNDFAPYRGNFTLKAKVEYYREGRYIPVDDGAVDFYVDNEILSNNSILSDGIFTSYIQSVENPAGDYTLYAKYSGSDIYAATEISKPFKIIGGNVKIFVPNITAKPKDIIQLQAQITDMNNQNIISAYIDFYIQDKDGNYIDFGIPNFNELTKNISIENGVAISGEIPLNIQLDSDLNTKRYSIEARYHYNIEDDNTDMKLYQVSNPNGYLNISKGSIKLEYPSMFYGTQYEPLGFIISVKDAETNQPVSNGQIQLSLKGENIEPLIESIDEDGSARFLYRPLEFSAKEWNELEKFSFDVRQNDLYKTYNDNEKSLYVDFLYNQEDGTLHYIGNKPGDTIANNWASNIHYNAATGKYYSDNKELIERDVSEHIYITNGNLYARTTKDVLRQYTVGLQDIEIKYVSDGQYKEKTEYVENGLNINLSDVDLDIHYYDLKYTDNTMLTCYASNYHFTNDGITGDTINDGDVSFVVDNHDVDIVEIVNGKSKLNSKFLSNINAGEHLIQVKYVSDDNQSITYSYALLSLNKEQPILYIDVDRKTPGKTTNAYVIFNTNVSNDIPLTGMVNLYLNNELIGTQFLNGTEYMPGLVEASPTDINLNSNYQIKVPFNITIPNDIQDTEYLLTASYEGNEFFLPAETNEPYPLAPEKYNVTIDIKRDIYVAKDETCFIDAFLSFEDDIINEGELVLEHGNTEVASSNVLNNKARLSWDITDTNSNYNIIYRNATNYNDINNIAINVHVIDPLDEIYIPNIPSGTSYTPNLHQQTIEEALMCLKSNGTIYITDDIILTQSIEINKDCTIAGENGVSLIKDVTDLLTDNIIVYDIEDVEEMNMIEGLSVINLNTTDFLYENKQLYIKTKSDNIPIFLAEDGLFYTESNIKLKDILSSVNLIINEDADVTLNNIIFKSNDSNSIADFAIYNKGTCLITHSVIESTAKIHNNGELTAHRNLIYGICQGECDLDNNWWGSNTAPYNVNNNIILTISSKNTPAVISEEIEVIGELIGANGRKYDIPQVNFMFTADTGYFSIDNGKFTNNKITTTYLDAEKEGNIYLTADNQTVELPIYDYEYKTEVIIDDIDEVLINYQMPITAKVQSCADTYYEFNNDNSVKKSTHPINEGFLTFYITKENGTKRQQIGYSAVVDGESSVKIFFSDLVYNINDKYKIEAEYHTNGKYFDSSDTITVTVINEDDICFVSSSALSSGDGTYGSPFTSISRALESNKNNIYLLSGTYNGTNIPITRNVTIKRYNGDVNFQNIESAIENSSLFNIQSDVIVNLIGINFINNDYETLIKNSGSLSVINCIFYKNKGTLFGGTGRLNVSLSAIVDNNNIANNINGNNYSKCWFGTNEPDNVFKNYIKMEHESSKNIIYIGTLAHITATLTSYVNNGQTYKLEEKIPLRIAKFATEVGSTKPITDYTYHNKSTSLVNTLADSNNYQYVITLENNVYYDKNDVILKCNVKDVFGNNATKKNNNTLKMHIQSDNINDFDYDIPITNGVAELNLLSLPVGRYTLNCTYVNEQVYTLSTYFEVKPLDIIIDECSVDTNSHLYYTQISAQVHDNFNKPIVREKVNIRIDDTFIKTITVFNGEINEKIQYDLLKPGKHVISIDNTDINTEYDSLYYEIPIISRQQKTTISFDYDTIEANVYNTLIVEVNDEEGREVQTGQIRVEIDDIAFGDNIDVSNGIAIIKNLKITEKGQHSIVIYYSDINRYYEDSSMVNSSLGVGIFNVKCSIANNDIIYADIGKDFNQEITVQDKAYQRVNGGYINIYIDGGIFSENNKVVNGLTSISKELPDGICAGTHRLTIEYVGNDDYLDTIIHAFLSINKINTEIGVNTVSGPSGQQAIANYNINSLYGIVNTGEISVFFKDNEEEKFLKSATVTDSIINQIAFTLPLVPAGNEYELIFKYHDAEGNYNDSETTQPVKLIIEKSKVIITPSKTWYYPQKTFNLNVDIKDKEGHIIDNGNIDLYIDNVKEYSDIKVVNGQAIIPDLIFNNARDYILDIVYQEDDYYYQTHYKQVFNVNNIDINIDNITFKNPLESLPNTNFTNEILFNLENYTVKDGVIDILFDNNLVDSYYMAENNHNVSFNIGQEKKGNHKLLIKYYNSTLFKDFEKEFDFKVLSKLIDLRINRNGIGSQDIQALSSDTITINTSFGNVSNNEWIPTPMTGIVKYYLLIPEYSIDELGNNTIKDYYERFIGLEEFNDVATNDNPFEYILTTELLSYIQNTFENQYKIKAHFIGNDEYEEAKECVYLNIYKQSTNVVLPQDMIFDYQAEVNIPIKMFDSNNNYIIGKEIVDVLINNKFIGSCVLIDGEGEFSYRLDDDYVVGSYDLKVIFNGSAVYEDNINSPAQSSFIIKAITPTLKTKEIDIYPGASYWLDSIIYDKNNAIINEGTLKYTYLFFDEPNTRTSIPNEQVGFQFPRNITEDSQIKVEYISDDLTKYSNFTEYIDVHVHKNPIKLSIYAPNRVYRGTPFDVTIKAEAPTTVIPVNLLFKCNSDANIVMMNGSVTFTITYDTNIFESTMTETISTNGSDVFESGSIDLNVIFKNYDNITVDPQSPESATNTHTLQKAINLVNDYGTIEVINSISNETITLDKSITIKGDTELINCSITNLDKKLVIEGITFTSNKDIDKEYIYNESILEASNCTFEKAQKGAIYTDGSASITKCIFKDNSAQNGACIYVANKNYKTSIIECQFNNNSASLYGGCIYSNKVNDMEILNNEFTYNNNATSGGSCIYGYGNITISSNSFYGNIGKNQIQLLRGNFAIDNNLFEQPYTKTVGDTEQKWNVAILSQQDAEIDVDFNYWGLNDIDDIKTYYPSLTINNYLIGEHTDSIHEGKEYITYVIDKYINSLEKEITTINTLEKTFLKRQGD